MGNFSKKTHASRRHRNVCIHFVVALEFILLVFIDAIPRQIFTKRMRQSLSLLSCVFYLSNAAYMSLFETPKHSIKIWNQTFHLSTLETSLLWTISIFFGNVSYTTFKHPTRMVLGRTHMKFVPDTNETPPN